MIEENKKLKEEVDKLESKIIYLEHIFNNLYIKYQETRNRN